MCGEGSGVGGSGSEGRGDGGPGGEGGDAFFQLPSAHIMRALLGDDGGLVTHMLEISYYLRPKIIVTR